MQVQAELTSITIIVLAALASGLVCSRLRLPSIIGYMIAGVVLGPSGLALVEDRGNIGLTASSTLSLRSLTSISVDPPTRMIVNRFELPSGRGTQTQIREYLTCLPTIRRVIFLED